MSISNATISGGNASASPSGGGIAVAGGSTATITNSVLNAGWGVRGGIINVCGTGTVLTSAAAEQSLSAVVTGDLNGDGAVNSMDSYFIVCGYSDNIYCDCIYE